MDKIYEIRVIDSSGDTKLSFDPSKPDEVSAAKELFDKMKGKGYLAYKVKKNGEPGNIMQKFDTEDGLVIMRPPISGG